jgi:hypothetical protein
MFGVNCLLTSRNDYFCCQFWSQLGLEFGAIPRSSLLDGIAEPLLKSVERTSKNLGTNQGTEAMLDRSKHALSFPKMPVNTEA